MVGDSGAFAWHGLAGLLRVGGTRSVVLAQEGETGNDVSRVPWLYVVLDFVAPIPRGLRPPSMLARMRPVLARWTTDVDTRSTIHP